MEENNMAFDKNNIFVDNRDSKFTLVNNEMSGTSNIREFKKFLKNKLNSFTESFDKTVSKENYETKLQGHDLLQGNTVRAFSNENKDAKQQYNTSPQNKMDFSKSFFHKSKKIRNINDLRKLSSLNKIEQNVGKIDALTVSDFLTHFSDEHMIKFYQIIGEHEICSTQIFKQNIQKPVNKEEEEFTELYCELFATKYIYNLKLENAFEKRCDDVTAVFPIPLHDNYDLYKDVQLEVIDVMDENIFEQVSYYLGCFRLKSGDVKKEVKHLIHSIYACDMYHVGMRSLLEADFLVFNRKAYIELLKKYMFFYAICMEKGKYVLYDLDECLLSPCVSEYYPLSFDKDLLQLAESYKLYERYKGNIFDIVFDIFNIAMFHYKSFHDVTDKYSKKISLDKHCLIHIMEYIKNIQNINSCIVHPMSDIENFCFNSKEGKNGVNSVKQEMHGVVFDKTLQQSNDSVTFPRTYKLIDSCFLWSDAHLLVNDTLIDFTYSRFSKNTVTDFYKLILCGALCTKKCSKLVLYNSYLGEETSMDMVKNTEEVKDFIRTYKNHKNIHNYLTGF